MIAIIFTTRTKYDCKVYFESDHIWLQSLSKGTKYDCNHGKFVFARFAQKSLSRDSRTNFDIAIVYGPFFIKIAIIFGPNHKNYCYYMWCNPIYLLEFTVLYTWSMTWNDFTLERSNLFTEFVSVCIPVGCFINCLNLIIIFDPIESLFIVLIQNRDGKCLTWLKFNRTNILFRIFRATYAKMNQVA